MPECSFCGEEFDSERELHLHWSEEHEDELNSHQEEKVKKARRQEGEKEKQESKRKKDLAFKGLVTFLAITVAVLVIPQMLEIYEGDRAAVENVSFNLEDQPMKGQADAEVTIVEFGDYYCPACKAFKQTVIPKIERNYIESGKVKLYYLDYPLDIHEPYATRASIAAQCVYRQDREKFWKYHDALYRVQRNIEYNVAGLTQLAEDSTDGLNYTALSNCIENEETLENVQRDIQKGSKLNVSGTPTIYVNGDKAERISYSNLKSLIERELDN